MHASSRDSAAIHANPETTPTGQRGRFRCSSVSRLLAHRRYSSVHILNVEVARAPTSVWDNRAGKSEEHKTFMTYTDSQIGASLLDTDRARPPIFVPMALFFSHART
ncbi:uncharacterized protein LOC111518804 isoform X2 [Drosophila willistoni]|nr:uncharacterized protein LOC111518804 isoform X2 [Drosophila willistoni]